MAKLNPPKIKSKLPAFYIDEEHTSVRIPFNLDRAVGINEFSSMSVIFRSVQSNVQKGSYVVKKAYNQISYDYKTHGYNLFCDLDSDFVPDVGQYYKVQIAFIDDVTDPANPQYGYYSDVGIIKCTEKPIVSIRNLETGEDNTNQYSYTGEYQASDPTEKVYSYTFNLYDSNGDLVATSGELLHNSSLDTEIGKSSDSWTVRKTLLPNVKYQIEYVVTTMNGLTASCVYIIMDTETLPPNVHANLCATSNVEDGYITLSLKGDGSKTYVNGSFILLRAGSDDNYDSWYELTKFHLSSWDARTSKVICQDHTISHGVQYKYAIQAYNTAGIRSNRLENIEGPINCDFEDAFLWDGERQLKIRFNPKVTSFKSTVLENKMDTIGGKYPFIFRNGNVEYKEFPISGLLSLLGDENNLFKTDLYKSDKNDRRTTPGPKNEDVIGISRTQLSHENIYAERQFKLEALAWLTNGKPKLFRSPAEGSYIVRLMNTSLSPNDTLGRMLHTFSSTAYEIADYTFDNLQQYGFTTAAYTEMRTMKVSQIYLGTDKDPYYDREKKTSYIPMAYFASIEGPPRTNFTYRLEGSNEILSGSTGLTGTFIFPDAVLQSTPLVEITPTTQWGATQLTFGYYDEGVDTFNYIYDIDITDRIIQQIGLGISRDIIDTLEDIRIKTGAFHYIKVAPREKVYIYNVGGNLCWNGSGDRINLNTLNANTLYFIVNSGQPVSSATEYLDGCTPSVRKKIADISYDFRLVGSQKVDFTGASALTTGRYEALTNLGSVSNIYAGDGIILDIVYQEKILTYAVENTDAAVIGYKAAWLQDQSNKEKYKMYIDTLTIALERMEDEYNVEHAI